MGIHGNSRKLSAIQIHVRFNLCVPESEKGEAGFIPIETILADVFDSLRHAAIFVAFSWCEICLGKIAVFIQGFSMPQDDFLPGFCLYIQFSIPCQVLPKVDQRIAVGRREYFSLESFLFSHGHTVGTKQLG